MRNKVLIIGGGMAGLSAGAYLQMNDYNTEIFELNSSPGGVCTSWKRGDYTVDLCLHWLVGSGEGEPLYDRWNELIEMDKLEIIDHEEYARVEDEQGNCIRLFTNVDRLEAELLEKAPEDKEEILEFIAAIRKFTHWEMENDKAPELTNIWEKMKYFWKMLPYMGVFGKFMRQSNETYAQNFKNPLLKKAITNLFEPEMAVVFSMMTLAWMHNKNAGYPIGGSMRFAQKIADRYEALGGKFHFNARVMKILTKEDQAIGIELENGEQYFGDYVISAADGYSTIYKMLEGKYLDEKLNHFYQANKTFPSLVFVALGLNRTFENEPHSLYIPVNPALLIDPETTVDDLYVRIHNFDPTLAPKGKTLITFMLETFNYQYWMNLYQKDRAQYEAQKERIAQALIEALEQRFGNVREKVEMVDVSTPVTFINFTNNWKGSFEGWIWTPEIGFKPLSHSLPGLNRFYMCGHWVAVGGGVPTAMMSGREAAQLICHEDGKAFKIKPLREKQIAL
ncbi:MAG: NAD(P)/FAD-dependent oxidoreductase [Saprospiraceae bacterium]|nr:NAD(P)/FAD-dependent oxidoreductase [Saprospiraceae bacterium]